MRFSSTPISGRNFDRFELKAADFGDGDDVSVEVSTSASSGVPILPPTSVGMFAVFRMCATSDVVVVLPFEPVMATSLPRRKRQASSISLQTGMPFWRARSRAAEFLRARRG